MAILKKILITFGGWICSYILFALIVEVLGMKLEGQLIGVALIIWPTILFISYIIKTIINFKNKKDIKLARAYRIILSISIISNASGSISSLFLVNQQLEMTDEIAKSKNNKINMIANILIYIATIVSLLLIGLVEANWKFICIVIMYGALACLLIIAIFISTRKERKENLEAIARDAHMSKGKLVLMPIIIIVMVFVIIFGVSLFSSDFITTTKPDKKADIKVKDNNYIESELSEDDYKRVEEEISNILNGEVEYKEISMEENLKNTYGERYNKITFVANLVTDSDEENSYNFIFYKYLTSSDKHELGEIEPYLYSKSSTIVKKDWCN
ncbi:unknown [Clostridium sp. CAG:354]|nr:hypothetical protein [Clostridium sp.]MEE0269110.1 hypothetical protein [Clostridia bacterium]CDE09990.1 unknown [Clostridium sp. CAG:354]